MNKLTMTLRQWLPTLKGDFGGIALAAAYCIELIFQLHSALHISHRDTHVGNIVLQEIPLPALRREAKSTNLAVRLKRLHWSGKNYRFQLIDLGTAQKYDPTLIDPLGELTEDLDNIAESILRSCSNTCRRESLDELRDLFNRWIGPPVWTLEDMIQSIAEMKESFV
jgi:hypothetical protein